tara:strand:+ start:68 stop:1402 length:1335 start_codon:yes stop_codon:yes gene_type:complete
MALLDSQPEDAYAHHLSQVNKKNQVRATEDIFNEQGVLLVKKGMPISEQLADQVIKHKLLRPIEHSVNIEKIIDAGRLFKAFSFLFTRYPDCEAVHQNMTLEMLLRDLCGEYGRFSLLQQKMTVLSMQRPHEFEKGLFCAWFSMALARKMDLSMQQISDAFMAGLIHDTGMLHISSEILDKREALTPTEWRTIQSHPLIGDLFLKQIPGLSPIVARATLEHHERRDGAGYPAGKFSENLCTEGQIVAIADSICAIRMLRLSGTEGNLANLLPIIQFNERSYDPGSYKALFSLIRTSGLEPGRILADTHLGAEIRILILAHRQLNRCFLPLDKVIQLLPESSDLRRVRSAIDQIHSCWFAVASSGLLADSVLQWLEQCLVNTEQEDYAAVEEVKVMLKELHWQLLQVRKSLAILKDDEGFKAIEMQQALKSALKLQEGLDEVFKR